MGPPYLRPAQDEAIPAAWPPKAVLRGCTAPASRSYNFMAKASRVRKPKHVQRSDTLMKSLIPNWTDEEFLGMGIPTEKYRTMDPVGPDKLKLLIQKWARGRKPSAHSASVEFEGTTPRHIVHHRLLGSNHSHSHDSGISRLRQRQCPKRA